MSRGVRFRWPALIAIVMLATAVGAQLTPAQAANIEATANHELEAQHLPSISVAVWRQGELAYAHAFGYSDYWKKVPATTGTLYRMASVSKPITAVAVMQLAKSGKLDLDAPAQRYCPVYNKHPEVTARLLLGHRSGIHHYKDDYTANNTKHYASLNEAVKIFSADKLEFTPGKSFLYTSYGYTLLGCEIEGASGQSYRDYVAAQVFAPLKMAHTFPDDSAVSEAAKAKFYSLEAGDLAKSKPFDSSDRLPGGGWLSTPSDTVRFAGGVIELLGPQWTRTMWTESTHAGEEGHYALGWGLTTVAGHSVAAHSGSQNGTSTALAYLPDVDLAVAVFINRDGVDAMKVADNIVEELLKK